MNNSNRIFVSTTFSSDDSKVSDVLQQCEENSISNVELGSNHSHEENFERILGKHPFQYLVHNYFPIPKDSFILNIASLNDQIRQRSIDHILWAIDFCKCIEARLYTFHPGFLTDPQGSNLDSNNYDFQFNDDSLRFDNPSQAFERLTTAISEIVDYSKNKSVQIAIETEGSISKKDHLIMQQPDEYKKFFSQFSPDDIGINLNLGHLNLASKAFGFSRDEFVNLISDYIVAMEMSHNNGENDDHLPLVDDEWYWDIISDPNFKKTYKILEFRESSFRQIRESFELCVRNLSKDQSILKV
jgi:sugar phosphate isomerase/epimerase